MLTEEDIQDIKAAREEIKANRTVTLKLLRKGESGGRDPITGDFIPGETESELVEATYRKLTSQSAGADGNGVVMVDGVVAEPGNAIANFDVSLDLTEVFEVIHESAYGNTRYVVKAKDRIGLGEVNRLYVILEKVI